MHDEGVSIKIAALATSEICCLSDPRNLLPRKFASQEIHDILISKQMMFVLSYMFINT